jgi:hypothetical protein
MRARHYKFVALVLAVQFILILANTMCVDARFDLLATVCGISASVITWSGFIFTFYDLPTFTSMSSVSKMICLTFTAMMAGVGGYFISILFLGMLGINVMD